LSQHTKPTAHKPSAVLPPANATVQHIYFFSQTQKPMHKKIKELHSQQHKSHKKADTQAEAK
jgi:hypothetical protein